MSRRVKGSYQILEVKSGARDVVYIDKMGLQSVAIISNMFTYNEKWFVHNVELEFVPNQPVTVGGTMTMAPDYDPIDPYPSNLQSMSNSYNFIQKPITSSCRCKMPNFKMPDGAFVRPTLYTGPMDVDRNVSYGKFNVEASSSLADNTSLGFAILHYDISFMVPQPYNDLIVGDQQDISIKVVMDNAGTKGPCPVRCATTEDDFLVYNNTHAAPSTIYGNRVYAGILSNTSTGSYKTAAGNTVSPGSRLFYKVPDSAIVADTITPIDQSVTASSIGYLSLSRTFDTAMAILVNRTADAWIDLINGTVLI